MPNANAEAQRRWRQRQKEKKKDGLKQGAAVRDVFIKPFFEFAENTFGGGSDFDVALGLIGIETPQFDDDRGPEAYIRGDHDDTELDDAYNPFKGAERSLGRAEVMVGCLITAAVDLASEINDYKRTEIKARIAEIEASDLSDLATKKAALKEVTRLNKMLDQLDKQVRWTFPQWKVTG
jgi:hypothetical protein